MIKGYKILEMIVKDELEDKTLIRTKDDLINAYYIYTRNDGKFHRCDNNGKLGSVGQTRFINYCNLDKEFEIVENKKEMIKISRGNFKIMFSNGYIVSVFNGFGSYSDNHFNIKLGKSLMNNENIDIESSNCEVAIMYNDLGFVNPLNWDDDVKGYVTPAELLEIMNKVQKL